LVDLETVARESDYISLHSPLIDSTRHIINADFLAKMKPSAYIVNAARGPLIDEEALLAAVRSGPEFGSTVNAIVCVPVPLAGMPVTHAGTSLVVHVQTDPVETVTTLCPPAVANDWPVLKVPLPLPSFTRLP